MKLRDLLKIISDFDIVQIMADDGTKYICYFGSKGLKHFKQKELLNSKVLEVCSNKNILIIIIEVFKS